MPFFFFGNVQSLSRMGLTWEVTQPQYAFLNRGSCLTLAMFVRLAVHTTEVLSPFAGNCSKNPRIRRSHIGRFIGFFTLFAANYGLGSSGTLHGFPLRGGRC